MIPTRFAYLTGTLLFSAVWLIIFILRPDLRKAIWVMSFLTAFSGLIPEYFWWTKDWWRPITITATRIGIEDFLLGYTNGGIIAVIYEMIGGFKLERIKGVKPRGIKLIYIPFSILLIGICVEILGMTSFWATVFTELLIAFSIIYFRRDLFFSSLFSGIAIVIIFMPVYWFADFISPGIIEKTWLFKNLSGLRITGVPVEDIVFYFLVGSVEGSFYKFWQGFRDITNN